MIDDVRQQLSRFGVEKGKIEVPVCYGGARERERERERDEICYFGEGEKE